MAHDLVSIELNRAGARFRRGDTISGYVVVRSETPVEVEAVQLELAWRTSGAGAEQSEIADTRTLAASTRLDAGEQRLPFALIAPPGPETYEGDLLSLGWEVLASLYPADGEVRTVTAPIVIDGAATDTDEGAGPYFGGKHVADPVVVEADRQTKMGCLTLLSLIFLVPALLGALNALSLLISGSPLAALATFTVAAIAAGAGLTLLWWGHRTRLAERRLGSVAVRFDTDPVEAGATLAGAVTFPVLKSGRLNAVAATLVGRERVIVRPDPGDGGLPEARTRDLHRYRLLLVSDREVTAGQAVELPFTFDVPEGAAPSLGVTDQRVEWYVEVHVDIPRWPDYVEPFGVRVVPTAEPSVGPAREADPATTTATGRPPASKGQAASLVAAIATAEAGGEEPEAERRFDFPLQVARVEWTASLMSAGTGRTVYGRVGGDGPEVAVVFAPEHNAACDALTAGDTIAVTAGWRGVNRLAERVELQAESGPDRAAAA